MYKYRDKPFDKIVGVELIINLFNGQENIKRSTLNEKVIKAHEKNGGKPPTIGERGKPQTYNWQIQLGLDALKTLQFANNPTHGYWNFISHDKMINIFKDIGKINFTL